MKLQWDRIKTLAEAVESKCHFKEDLVKQTGEVDFESVRGDDGSYTGYIFHHLEEGGGQLKMLSRSHSQMAQWMGNQLGSKGTGWYGGLFQKGLLDGPLNALLKTSTDTRLLRTYTETEESEPVLRAWLSDSYSLEMDDAFLLSSLIPALKELRVAGVEFDILTTGLSETNLFVQLFFGGLRREIQHQSGGDTDTLVNAIAPAVTITNSEVGASALDISFGVYRYSCSNMAVQWPLWRRKHLGVKIPSGPIVRKDTLEAKKEAYRLEIRDTLLHAVSELTADKMLEVAQSATADRLPESSDFTIASEKISKRFFLTDTQREMLRANVIADRDSTRWGWVNSLTAMAQDMEDIDQQCHLEKAGGKLLSMNSKEWGALVI